MRQGPTMPLLPAAPISHTRFYFYACFDKQSSNRQLACQKSRCFKDIRNRVTVTQQPACIQEAGTSTGVPLHKFPRDTALPAAVSGDPMSPVVLGHLALVVTHQPQRRVAGAEGRRPKEVTALTKSRQGTSRGAMPAHSRARPRRR